MVRVGITGIGFMGWIHYLAYQRSDRAKVTAISSRDPKKLAGDWRGIQGNFGPKGEQMDLSGIDTHQDIQELLANDQVDVVDICLPPHLHCETAIAALEAGKHVFCEKPLGLTAEECERMVAAAEKSGKQLLTGHVLPMFPEYAKALEIIHSGEHGRLLGGQFKRIISDPTWLKDFYDPQRVGGPLIDLHVHDAHLIRMLFGMPHSVCSQGRMRGEVVEFCTTIFQFDDPSYAVSATSGVINQQGRPFTHGFEIYLEKATLLYDMAVIGGEAKLLMPLTILTEGEENNVRQVEVESGDDVTPFHREVDEMAQAIESGQPSPVLGGELARDAVILCQKETESVGARQPVKVKS